MFLNGVSFVWRFNHFCFIDSEGNKFYIILAGCVSIKIPNPIISEFKERYSKYLIYLEENNQKEELNQMEKEFMLRKKFLTKDKDFM